MVMVVLDVVVVVDYCYKGIQLLESTNQNKLPLVKLIIVGLGPNLIRIKRVNS